MNEITQILSKIEQGDPHAAEELLPLVYAELRRLAAQKLVHENPGQTLDATGLGARGLSAACPREPAPATLGSTGTAADISLPPPPRPCDGFLSKTPAASHASNMAAG